MGMRNSLHTVCAFVLIRGLASVVVGADPGLSLSLPSEEDGLSVSINGGAADRIYRLEVSDKLDRWWPVFAKEGLGWAQVFGSDELPRLRFFRMIESVEPQVPIDTSWANSVQLPDDPLRSKPFYIGSEFIEQSAQYFIKFTILRDDLTKVYFQNSTDYLFHYEFGVDRLPVFSGLSREAYDRQTLYFDPDAYLGAVVFVPDLDEYAIELVGQDVIPRETVRHLYQLVDAAVGRPSTMRGFYMPTFEQRAEADAAGDYWERHGIDLADAHHWIDSDQTYSSGYAIGRLVFVEGDSIEEAYADGTLRASDILLTDAVPAEIPFVQGILSLSPGTPNSHVAILAQAGGIPYAYLASPDQRLTVQSWIGTEIVLNVGESDAIEAFPLPSDFPSGLRERIAGWKTSEVEVEPIQAFGAYSLSVETLVPADNRYFGGKASNFGFLRRAIPDHSPPAIAFSFDLWREFLQQPMGGSTLAGVIDDTLSKYRWPVSDLEEMYDDLDDIRDLIEDDTVFTAAQETAIFNALNVFDADRKIRFRSSTNMEDSRTFVGAGLYESKSGCLLDDLDSDDVGPSLCDPEEKNERGVFRALRKVFASFYNDNAFLERRRFGVSEDDVGMAVLVHHSFPDEIELANGVATAEVRRWSGGTLYLRIKLVTQKGAESVTNPEGGSLPEVVEVYAYANASSGTRLYLKQHSNRVAIGGYVMEWEADYRLLSDLLEAAVLAFDAYGDNSQRPFYTLDFEYKKMGPDGDVVVKQIREVPAGGTQGLSTVLIGGDETEWEVFQGENSDVYAIHRLKNRMKLTFEHRVFDEEGVGENFVRNAEWVHRMAGSTITLRQGAPASWPSASHQSQFDQSWNEWSVSDSWTETVFGESHATVSLTVGDGAYYAPTSSPLRHGATLHLDLSAAYQAPVTYWDYLGRKVVRSEETVMLIPRQEETVTEEDLLQQRNFATEDASVSVDIRFYWPPYPGAAAGYTAPLRAWDRTVITGLTTSPITLTDYFSQTYRPEHHNFAENFIFEPRLAPNVTPAQLDELEARNIEYLYLVIGLGSGSGLYAVSPEGIRRKL